MSHPWTVRARAHRVAPAYVLGGAAGMAVLLPLAAAGVLPGWVPWAWTVTLGPVGLLIVAGCLAVVDTGAVPVALLHGVPVEVLAVAGYVLIALMNVRLLTSARAGRDRRRTADLVIGSTLFSLAGIAFVAACFFDGFTMLVQPGAGGVDPDQVPVPVRELAGGSLVAALVVAVAGLVAWPLLWTRRRRLTGWAAAGLVAQVALMGVVLVVEPVLR